MNTNQQLCLRVTPLMYRELQDILTHAKVTGNHPWTSTAIVSLLVHTNKSQWMLMTKSELGRLFAEYQKMRMVG